jgi:hypothetical protein
MYLPSPIVLTLSLTSHYSTPETFDIVTHTVDVAARKNLAQISKILTQITSGVEFGEDSPSYVPINDYVSKTISRMTTWMLEGWYSTIHASIQTKMSL